MNVKRITLNGEYDLSHEVKLQTCLAIAESADIAEIDMTKVTYIDSTALRCFLRLKQRMVCGGYGGEVRIVNPSRNIERLFRMCGLDALFTLDVRATSDA